MAEATLDIDLRFTEIEARLAATEGRIATSVAKGAKRGTDKAALEIAALEQDVAAFYNKNTAATGQMAAMMKRQIQGEIIGGSIRALASGFDGVAEKAGGAVATIAQGFAQGGPAGAALMGVSQGLSMIVEGFVGMRNEAKRAAEAARVAFFAAQDAAEKALDSEIAKLGQANEARRVGEEARKRGVSLEWAALTLKVKDAEMARDAAQSEAERDRLGVAVQTARMAREEAFKRSVAASTVEAEKQSEALRKQAAERRKALKDEIDAALLNARWSRIGNTFDTSAEDDARRESELGRLGATIGIRDRKEAIAKFRAEAEERVAAQEEEYARKKALRDQDLADQAAAIDLEVRTFEEGERRKEAASKAASEAMQESARALSSSIAGEVGSMVGDWALYCAAAQQASDAQKQSAADIANGLAAMLQSVLATVAKEAAVKAVLALGDGLVCVAKAIASYGADVDSEAAGAGYFSAAATYATIAAGSAIAARGIGSVRGATASERASAQGAGGSGTGAGASGGGGAGVVINYYSQGGLFATRAEAEADLLEAQRRAERRA